MIDPLITLTTDFGTKSPYVAAMKGVILLMNPAARLVDLSHDIPPQDIRHAAFFVAAALPHFPPKTLHVIVIDPGVGTERAILYVEWGTQRLLVPDNGCWTLLRRDEVHRVFRLTNAAFWRRVVSRTFHGRDVFAPVAGNLSLGLDPVHLGPMVSDWEQLHVPGVVIRVNEMRGEVMFVDDFGNLLTNIPPSDKGTVVVGDVEVTERVRAYGEAAPGTLVALTSSFETLEIAEVQGSAARRLGAHVGTPVSLRRAAP
jgi:S-adenosyl-L-methionine hydrolase (adenosine-forming)